MPHDENSGLEEVREQHIEEEEYIPELDEYEEDRLPEVEDESEVLPAPLVLNDADFYDDGEFEV